MNRPTNGGDGDRDGTSGATTPDGEGRFRIGFLVHDVSRMRRTLFDQEMRPFGITRSQWWVLAQLSRAGISRDSTGMLQSDLARKLDIGKAPMTGLIDRLEESGFVERRPDRNDRRAKRIVITDRGHDILDRMASVGLRLNQTVLAGLTPDEIAIAEKVLSQMKENIRTITDPRP